MVVVNRKQFTQALKAAKPFANDAHKVRLHLNPTNGFISVNAENEFGDVATTLEAQYANAWMDGVITGYNVNYLLDAVSGFMDRTEITLYTNDNRILTIGDTSERFAMIMPFTK